MKKSLAILISYILVQNAYADEFVTTESNKRIILQDDGTWKYAPIKNGEKAVTSNGKTIIVNSDGTWTLSAEATQETPPEIIEGTVQETDQEENIKSFCDQNVTLTVDKIDKSELRGINEYIIISEDQIEGIIINLLESERSVIFTAKPIGAGNCIERDGKMQLLFRNGETMVLQNKGDFNCKPKFTTYFGGVWKQTLHYDILKNNELETIRVWTDNGYVQEDLSPEVSKELMNSFKCFLR